MEKKYFKSESKQLLNLMIHSIYSNKDVFLRELISNASDAIDKKEFLKIQGKVSDHSESKIIVDINVEERYIKITDSGIGMNLEEVEANLGTIAHSGSKEFLNKFAEGETEDVDIIGQFGVGFYSSFIVAEHVVVDTLSEGNDAVKFISDGIEAYEIGSSEKTTIGTEILIYLREGEEFDHYLEKMNVQNLIKEHSDFVKYPIYMLNDEENPVYHIINSQVAIWKKDKRKIKNEEYNDFYMSKYYDFMPPSKIIHAKSEGVTNLDMLLFIPSKKPQDFYTQNFKKGLSLYCRGVLIDDCVDTLLPDYFGFVKGIVDSEDLNLNISREMLQKDAKVDKITNTIKVKIQKELKKMLDKKREDYEVFYAEFGRSLMFGVYDNFGANAKDLKDLVMFNSSLDDKYCTLKEYVARNSENEKIYYSSGESLEKIKQNPVYNNVISKGHEVLLFTNDVDEFAMQVLKEYDGKEFVNIMNADFDTEEEKKEYEELKEQNSEILNKVKTTLIDKIVDVRLSSKLGEANSALINDNGMSIEQEKLLMQMPDFKMPSSKILEINPKSELFKLMNDTNYEDISKVLFYEAQIIEGLEISDPLEFTNIINKLITK